MLLAIAILIATICLLYLYVLRPFYLSPLSKIPNAHFSSPITSWWIDHKRATTSEVLAIYDAHQRLGPVVRLGPKELSVNSLEGLKIIYTGAFEKHSFYRDFVNFQTENLVGTIHNRAHAQQKRLLSRIYSKSYLQNSPDLRDISAMLLGKRLLPLLGRAAGARESLNVLPLFQAVGMDFTSSFIFGTQNGTMYLLQPEEWKHWLAEYEKFKYMSRSDRYMGFIESWCLSLCRRIQQRNDKPNDMTVSTKAVVYDQLRGSLELQFLEQPHTDSKKIELAVASELLDHLIAGHETSGIAFTYMMWELSQRPDLQNELRRELLTLTPQLKHPLFQDESNETDLPHPSQIDSLPLLDAIVRETLRLYAPAPAQLPRVTPATESGISINGYDNIPEGVTVSSSAYCLHRIQEIYPRPFEWRPHRWLQPEEGKSNDMRRLFWPFGSGGRMCLGSNFALQQIKLVMAAVYTNYSTCIVSDEGIEQKYTFIALPRGKKLELRFLSVNS